MKNIPAQNILVLSPTTIPKLKDLNKSIPVSVYKHKKNNF